MAKSMYKGSYTKDEIKGDHQIVPDGDDKLEKKLRAKGYVDGKEFFARPAEGEEPEPKEPAKPEAPAKPAEPVK